MKHRALPQFAPSAEIDTVCADLAFIQRRLNATFTRLLTPYVAAERARGRVLEAPWNYTLPTTQIMAGINVCVTFYFEGEPYQVRVESRHDTVWLSGAAGPGLMLVMPLKPSVAILRAAARSLSCLGRTSYWELVNDAPEFIELEPAMPFLEALALDEEPATHAALLEWHAVWRAMDVRPTVSRFFGLKGSAFGRLFGMDSAQAGLELRRFQAGYEIPALEEAL